MTAAGSIYFLHSKNPRARVGIVCECVSTRSARTDVNRISSSRVEMLLDLYGSNVDRECR